jgi:hypothetical protein
MGKEIEWTTSGSTNDSFMSFATKLNGSEAEKMRITSGGKVGIGTDSPSSMLTIAKAVDNGGGIGDATVTILNSDNPSTTETTQSTQLDFSLKGTTDNGVAYSAQPAARIKATKDGSDWFDNTGTYDDWDGQLEFYTVNEGALGTAKMVIDTDGNVGIAMTPGGSHKLDVTGSAGLSTGTAWTNTSDERIKTNIETIENGLDKINQLRPVSFNYSEDYLEQHPEIDSSKKYNSFLAQEYAEVFPDAVSICSNLEKVIVEAVEGVEAVEAVEAQDATYYEEGDELLEDKEIGDIKTEAVEVVEAVEAVEAVAEEKEVMVEDMLQFTPHDLNMYLVKAIQELSAKVDALEGSSSEDSAEEEVVESSSNNEEPSMSWKKDDLKAYMDTNEITYNPGDTKQDLLDKIAAEGGE